MPVPSPPSTEQVTRALLSLVQSGAIQGLDVTRTMTADGAGLQLGGHVTWLRLPAGPAVDDTAGRRQFFDELGRWLGAYMYGHVRDQLL